MVNLHADLCKSMVDRMAAEIKKMEDTLIVSHMEDILIEHGANLAKERFGMSPTVYYLYLYILKWGYTVTEVGDLPGAYCIKVDAGPGGKTRTMTLEKPK